MDTIKLIVGLIVVVAWIVGNIRERQKAAAKAAPPPVRNDGPPEAPRPPNELDTYLEEVRRRMGEPEAVKTDKPLSAVSAEELPRSEPKRVEPPRSQQPTQKKKRREQPAAPSLSRRAAEVTTLVPDPIRLPASGAFESTSTPLAKRAPSPVVKDVLNLLKSPNGLSTAFLLREILSEPMCKRPPGSRRKGI